MNPAERAQLRLILWIMGIGIAIGALLFFWGAGERSTVTIPVQVGEGGDLFTQYVKTNIPPGKQGIRTLFIQNSGSAAFLVHLKPVGEYRDWVSVGKSWIFLAPAVHRALAVSIRVPPEANAGAYNLTMEVISHRISI